MEDEKEIFELIISLMILIVLGSALSEIYFNTEITEIAVSLLEFLAYVLIVFVVISGLRETLREVI